jgi:phage shock protein C
MAKRLMRSKDDKMICGVAAGIARYLDVDPTVVRILWVVALLVPGSNILVVGAYLVLCFLMPQEVPAQSA